MSPAYLVCQALAGVTQAIAGAAHRHLGAASHTSPLCSVTALDRSLQSLFPTLLCNFNNGLRQPPLFLSFPKLTLQTFQGKQAFLHPRRLSLTFSPPPPGCFLRTLLCLSSFPVSAAPPSFSGADVRLALFVPCSSFKA